MRPFWKGLSLGCGVFVFFTALNFVTRTSDVSANTENAVKITTVQAFVKQETPQIYTTDYVFTADGKKTHIIFPSFSNSIEATEIMMKAQSENKSVTLKGFYGYRLNFEHYFFLVSVHK